MSERVETFQFDGKQTIRLDKYLVTVLPEYSRSRLQKLIVKGHVKVAGKCIVKNGHQLDKRTYVEVRIPPKKESDLVPEKIPLDIVFENEDLIIINKPAGMVVHPSIGHATGTLVHAALAHAPEMEGVGEERRPGVVHRLDKDTSGLILMAKNDSAHQWLQQQFRSRTVKKSYIALVDGMPPTPEGRIEASIGRNSSARTKMAVVAPSRGRRSVSEYHTLETFAKHTLLDVHPITGRTHQIRLHLDFVGCPVAGDTLYGRNQSTIAVKRHFLHAYRISFCLPGDSEFTTYEAPLPSELEEVLDELRRTN